MFITTVKCKYCGEEVERLNTNKNPCCFKCKMKRHKERRIAKLVLRGNYTPRPPRIIITYEEINSEKLNPREKLVLEQRFIKFKPLKVIGKSIGLSGEGVRQIEKVALTKLGLVK